MPATRPEFARIRLAYGKSAYFRELPAATLDALAAASTLALLAVVTIILKSVLEQKTGH